MIVFPRYVVGEDVIRKNAGELAKLGQRPIIIGGQKAMNAALKPVQDALASQGIAPVSVELYGHECTYGQMERLAQIARQLDADLVIGIGGGKALDTAKGCAHKTGLPVVTVPTIASTCAAVTALSVVYTEESLYIESMFHDTPPDLALIDLQIIADSPEQYLRAGIGDAMAKHVECAFAVRGRELSHSCAMAVAISRTSFDPLLQYGVQALADARENRVSFALEQAVLSNIVSTGLVSLLIDECYNGAIAHALFYGLTKIEDFEKKCLHGDAVGYGILVQQMLDGQTESLRVLHPFLKEAGMPVSMKDMGCELTEELLELVVPASIKALYDSRKVPYDVRPEMLAEAIRRVEAMA